MATSVRILRQIAHPTHGTFHPGDVASIDDAFAASLIAGVPPGARLAQSFETSADWSGGDGPRKQALMDVQVSRFLAGLPPAFTGNVKPASAMDPAARCTLLEARVTAAEAAIAVLQTITT